MGLNDSVLTRSAPLLSHITSCRGMALSQFPVHWNKWALEPFPSPILNTQRHQKIYYNKDELKKAAELQHFCKPLASSPSVCLESTSDHFLSSQNIYWLLGVSGRLPWYAPECTRQGMVAWGLNWSASSIMWEWSTHLGRSITTSGSRCWQFK